MISYRPPNHSINEYLLLGQNRASGGTPEKKGGVPERNGALEIRTGETVLVPALLPSGAPSVVGRGGAGRGGAGHEFLALAPKRILGILACGFRIGEDKNWRRKRKTGEDFRGRA